MPNIVVVTPTYKKFDLCVKMIESANAGTRKPDDFIVLDNSSGKFSEYLTDNKIRFDMNVSIITAPYNVGCEPAWNILLDMVRKEDPNALVIVVNDDIQFYADSIARMVTAAQEDYANHGAYSLVYCAGGMDAPNAFSFFMVHPDTFFDTLGRFQTTFAPAYYGDNDMHYRMKLMGYDLTRVSDCSAFHGEGSATLKAYSKQEEDLHHHQFRRNTDLYVRMHGGLPGKETYRQMFNGEDIMKHMQEIFSIYGF